MTRFTDEKRPHVAPEQVFNGLTFAPLPEGCQAEAVFALVKLNSEAGDGEDAWCVRTTGSYNRLEFLRALSSYVLALTQDEARGWMEDEDDDAGDT